MILTWGLYTDRHGSAQKFYTGLPYVLHLDHTNPIPQSSAVRPLHLKDSIEESAPVNLTGPLVLQCGWNPSEAQMCPAVAGAIDKVIQQQGAAVWLSTRLQTAVWSCASHMRRILYSGNYLSATTTQATTVTRQGAK